MCAEPFNKVQRSKVECLNCEYVACRLCIKRYLLESSLELSCMNCKVAWNPEFIRTTMPAAFLEGEYKHHRANMLLSLEESMLPQTQSHIQYKINKANALAEVRNLKNQITELQHQIHHLKSMYQNKYQQYHQLYGTHGTSLRVVVEQRREFVMKCPETTCRGFLSTQYKCGLCAKYFCRQCHQLKSDDEHVCKEDDVKTVKLLKENTKQCPNCNISIFKVYGCDQMWCTNCQTPFSWTTGRVIQGGTIHNPHYFDWQRRRQEGPQQQNNHGGMCGNVNTLRFQRFPFLNEVQQDRVYLLVRTIEHVRCVTIQSLTENENRFEKNLDIRIQYLNGDISKDEFKQRILRRDKASQRKHIMLMLWQTFVASYTDLLQNLSIEKNFEKFETEHQELLKCINSEFKRISKLYSTQTQLLDNNWTLIK